MSERGISRIVKLLTFDAMAEESTAASSVSSVPSDRESLKEDTAEYSSVVSPYQD